MKLCSAITILLIDAMLGGAFVAVAAETNTAPFWPIYHGDAALSGITGANVPDRLKIQWRFKAGAAVSAPPVVGGNMIFFVAEDGHLYALSLQGQKVWERRIDVEPAGADGKTEPAGKFFTAPLYVRDIVLAGSDDGWLYAIESATGRTRWRYKVGGSINSTANWLEPDGDRGFRIVVISRWDGVVHCIDLASGRALWVSRDVGECDGTPGVGSDFVAFGGCDMTLHILSASKGDEVGAVALSKDQYVAGGVAISGDMVFAGTYNGSIVCVDAGKKKIVWSNRVANGEIFATPAVTTDRVVAGSYDGLVYCLDRNDGKKVWSFEAGDAVLSPAIAAGDKVVVAAGGVLYVLRLKDGGKLWAASSGDAISSPAIVDGKLIVGTDEGFVIMYGDAMPAK